MEEGGRIRVRSGNPVRRFWLRRSLFTVLYLALPALLLHGLLFHPPCRSNRAAAIAALRTLASAQEAFRRARIVDLDGDGIPEYGTFGELTAVVTPRADPAGRARARRLSSPLLSPALADLDSSGIVLKSGYCFRIFLPARDGGGAHEGASGPAPRAPGSPSGTLEEEAPEGPLFSAPIDTDGAEFLWCAYAWPARHGVSEVDSFFVDRSREVWLLEDGEGDYDGKDRTPAFDAAFPRDAAGDWAPPPIGAPAEHVGRDGNTWRRLP
ncbi:MAG: hypothetical protein L6R43_07940 [Planctomycetes bacterium]|nr:hypothetical protein [Planctomycetota bacterium]